MSPDQVFGIVIVSIAAWTVSRVLRGPLGEALSRRIGGRTKGDGNDAQVDALQSRLAELEERMDFTERVLLREREVGQLRPEESS
ncbi:MAG TPA: hypothetical protein VHR43_16455 [Gemmatimonadales bacterium]|jgi:hypothetical protein|nr:hypothetical protein [Gemmatimonadales bacterium]